MATVQIILARSSFRGCDVFRAFDTHENWPQNIVWVALVVVSVIMTIK